MKQFFKYMLASMTGLVLLMFIFFLVFLSMVMNASKGQKVSINDNSVLHLKLNYELRDRSNNNPFDLLASDLSGDISKPVGLHDMLSCLEKAKTDDKIKGVFLDLTGVGAGYGKLTELRDGLEEFKSSGKFVYAYAEIFYNKTYYLASVADKVYMNPSGSILFNGMVADITFVKETLAKLGVEMQVIKRGKFKGAVEPYVLDGLSDENRKQITAYLESIYGEFLNHISASRNVSVEELRMIADSLRVKTGEDALALKMIDGVAYRDEVMTAMATTLGLGDGESPEFLTINSYNKSRKLKVNTSTNEIAVIYADGDIVSGKGQSDEIGSDRFAKALKQAREDENVKAVVLRVNSPGGSALASDVIWRETKLMKGVKPLIISMGDVAASGGYFIACMGDSILAMPNSITGSIGVFGLYPNAQELYGKIGLHSEVVKTSDLADFGRIDRPLNEKEKQILDVLIGSVYDRFLSRVEEGRELDRAHIDTIAEGRVWTGEYAKQLGLIDEFGGLEKAVDIAAFKAGIQDDYKLSAYPKSSSPFEEFVSGFSTASLKNKVLKEELGSYYGVYNKLQRLKNISGVQAIMPYQIELN